MSFHFENLDDTTRAFMTQEVESDIASGRLYLSQRFSSAGDSAYPDLLREAVAHHDEGWLASQIRMGGLMNAQEQRRTPKGNVTFAAVPVTAPQTLADGEFNRFYMRGLCLRAQQESVTHLTVYRGKQVENARSESQWKIGTSIPVQNLLDDLRRSVGIDTILGLPPGPNSGLSVRLP